MKLDLAIFVMAATKPLKWKVLYDIDDLFRLRLGSGRRYWMRQFQPWYLY
ncbi:MAG: hypothetical protein MJZ04_02955 [Bacteroidales bacterium]|nr:hypothetical protein [Candidatus Cryptobacteroides onthequi]MCQ2164119.1 hypothetical protein [Bacteroidales bacterium]